MTNKLWREAREIARLFCMEKELSLKMAESNLQERLANKREKVRHMVERLIKYHIPEDDLNG